MKGLDAIAGALRTSADRLYTVPGFPVTRLGAVTGAEMVINEKTALEYALGDSLSGRRAAVIIKCVGLNACADPLLQATAQGLTAGVVIVAGDDPGAEGSQTAQDSRYYGEIAEVPVIEPDSRTCYSGVEEAFRASERFSRISILRLTPGILNSEVEHDAARREDGKGMLSDRSWTMNGRITAAEKLYRETFAWSDTSRLNLWHGDDAGTGPCPGSTRIVTVNPMPQKANGIHTFHEEGRPFARDHAGIAAPPAGKKEPESMEDRGFSRTFCPDCPFKPMMDCIRDAGLTLICDAGCSILGMTRPYEVGLASYGMGASIAVAARSTRAALIGDYALLHSGLNALIDVYEKKLPLLCIVMTNNCAAMTGKQPAYNVLPYLTWAEPVVCAAGDKETLRREIAAADRPKTIVLTGTCPEG
jgi:TPP-dependent indolepyruvate ferredoxin oxidoreductase alpha subunit